MSESDNRFSHTQRVSIKRKRVLNQILISALALAAAFPLVLLGLRTLFYRDWAALGYPMAFFERQALLSGELPLWNPYSHCGVPFMAQWGSWYPSVFLGLIFPAPWIDNFVTLLHLAWGGLGMYTLCRRWKIRDFSACVAAFGYTFNGVTLSCHVWGNYIASLGWLPWIVLCVGCTWTKGGKWIAYAAMASAMQVLTATPELTLMTWAFIGALWSACLFSRNCRLWLSLARMTSAILLAAGVTMIQMLPFIDLLWHSQRDRPFAASCWAMPGWGWANLLVPLFHCYRAPQGIWFQPSQEFIPSYYPGAGILVLGIAGIWFTRTARAWVIAGAALFCWILALGPDGLVYDWLLRILPVIGIARFPIKFAIFTAFLLPILAGWGLDGIRSAPKRAGRKALAAIGGMVIALMGVLLWFAARYPFQSDNWGATARNAGTRAVALIVFAGGILLLHRLKDRILRRSLQLGLLTIIVFEGLFHTPLIVPTLPSATLAPGAWAAVGRPPAPKVGEGRIMISPEAEQQLLYSRVPDPALDLAAKRLAEWYNFNLLDSIPKVAGVFTLRPAHWDLLERYIYLTPNAHFGDGLLNFLSVAYYSDPQNPVRWSARTNYLPVITAGQGPVFVKDDDEALRGITADDFQPAAVVFLPQSERAAVKVSRQTTAAVHNPQFAANRVTAEIEAAEPSLVVLSQTFYHQWMLTIDDQPSQLWRANLAFQAFQVPAGRHRVRLVYRDQNVKIGGAISGISLLACLLLWLSRKPGCVENASPQA